MVKKKKTGLKEKVKTELGYIGKGAKALPKVAGKKIKEAAEAKWKEYKEEQKFQREIEAEARTAAKEVYKKERKKALIAQAKEKARQEAQKKRGGTGFRGALATLGEVGKRLETHDITGLGDLNAGSKKGSGSGVTIGSSSDPFGIGDLALGGGKQKKGVKVQGAGSYILDGIPMGKKTKKKKEKVRPHVVVVVNPLRRTKSKKKKKKKKKR